MTEDSKKNDDVFISWVAPEFTRYEKSKIWFILLGIISATLIIIALLMKNFLFALIIFMAAFLIYVQGLKHPRKIKFTISEEGLTIDEKTFHYSELKSFWIFEEPGIRILSVITKKLIQPQLSIPLEDQSPEIIRKALIRFIPERKQEETLTDIITRKLKF